MIDVLIVDNSPVIQKLLTYILDSDPEIKIAGVANDGEEAIEMVKEKRPDVITMDINMPKLNGIESTRRIMQTCPTPIVVVSGAVSPDKASLSFEIMEAGALSILQLPVGIGHPNFDNLATELKKTVKVFSEVKVVKRIRSSSRKIQQKKPLPKKREQRKVQVVAIGASTGGPLAIQEILSGIGKDFSVPILIVQHIAPSFLPGFANWLSKSSNLPVHIAEHKEEILPGNVYLAPDGHHMAVDRSKRIKLSVDPPENSHRPSIKYLFRSVAKNFGENAIGILLTGMGKDGARELKLMRDRGAITLAQDAASSVVHGMPGEAIRLEGAAYVLPPEKMPGLIRKKSRE